jgi:lipopolysaccharide transport system ATP-binding protein
VHDSASAQQAVPQGSPAWAVEVRGLVKRYPLFGRRRDRAFALFGRTANLSYVTALDGIDLEVAPGEAVGIIGDNGSGKSTLLRLVAGISAPTAGTVRAAQPLAPILELGLGFHPEFTGRENALLYGTLLGIDEVAMKERLGDVLDFAELDEFIDQPLRTYSSGMAARLAFAVATHVDPSVLVVDEALAVGDGAFQKKCLDRMVRFKQAGRTVLFCSHGMYLVTAFCDRAAWLHHGRIQQVGPAQEVVEQYESYLMQREKRRVAAKVGSAGLPGPLSHGGKRGRLTGIRVLDADGRETDSLDPGEGLTVELGVESVDPGTLYHVAVAIDAQDGRCVFGAATHWDGIAPISGVSRQSILLRIPALPIAAGSFSVSGFLFDDNGLHTYDQVVVPAAVNVTSPRWTPSLLHLPHEWVVPG